MTESFTDLYEKASKREAFSHLYDLITSIENIRLAYRTMKSNKGSNTPASINSPNHLVQYSSCTGFFVLLMIVYQTV